MERWEGDGEMGGGDGEMGGQWRDGRAMERWEG